MIIIPNKTKPVFVCTYEVNYVDGIYKTKIINEKNEEIYIGYENYFVIQNIDENNNLWVEENVIKVQKNGKYGLVEIKLGGEKLIEEGATSLKALTSKIDTEKMKAPSFLMVLTGTGDYAYRRQDGVLVVPVGCLKN